MILPSGIFMLSGLWNGSNRCKLGLKQAHVSR